LYGLLLVVLFRDPAVLYLRADRFVHLQVERGRRSRHPVFLVYLPRGFLGAQVHGLRGLPGVISVPFIQSGAVLEEDGDNLVGVLSAGRARRDAEAAGRERLPGFDELLGDGSKRALILPEVTSPVAVRSPILFLDANRHPAWQPNRFGPAVRPSGRACRKAGLSLTIDSQLMPGRQ
jgi:hypothetical protein